jgi:RNA-directed DNA polymerase
VWIVDADLSAAFDKIDHSRLLSALGSFPARDMIARWLKAGVIEDGAFTPTEEGTPQGGVISPLMMNVALHGLEEAAGVRYQATGRHAGDTRPGCPVLIRYADDLVVCAHSREQAEQVKAGLAEWLAPRGLVFNEDKTKIVRLTEGFDFLGFNVRRYQNGKLLIKPSPAAVRRLRKRLAAEMRALRGSNAAAVIAALTPVIRGWAAYYRGVVSSEIFNALDTYVWKLTYRWAKRSHPGKPKRWIVSRYFGRFAKFRNDRWVFGNRAGRDERGSVPHLVKFSWTGIVRHQMVTGTASPDDPDLTGYWAARRLKVKPPLDSYSLRLLARQDGRCPLCGDHLLTEDQPPQSPREWERWWLSTVRRAIAAEHLVHHDERGTPDSNRTRLIHASCRRELQARKRRQPALQPATPSRLA